MYAFGARQVLGVFRVEAVMAVEQYTHRHRPWSDDSAIHDINAIRGAWGRYIRSLEMLTVKVGEVINQLRNITGFGIVLCAISILVSLNLDSYSRNRFLLEDYLAYLVLEESIKTAKEDDELKGCLNAARIGQPCRLIPWHAWLGRAAFLDAIRQDIGSLQPAIYQETKVKYWKSDKVVFDIEMKNGQRPPSSFEPVQFWTLARAEATDPQEPLLQAFIGRYAIIVDSNGYMYPVSQNGFVGDPKHKILRLTSMRYEETDAWVASLGQGYPSSISGLSLQDPMLSKLVHDYYRVENMHETIAGLTIPLNYAPAIISALLVMSSVLLIGIAAAFNMARSQGSLLTEEYGWPLLYSGGGVAGWITFGLGVAMAVLALSVPLLAMYLALDLQMDEDSRMPVLWVLFGSLGALSVAIILNIVLQLRLRYSIRVAIAEAEHDKEEREMC
jgi:hypothetical protein